jgi:hypothetical protein
MGRGGFVCCAEHNMKAGNILILLLCIAAYTCYSCVSSKPFEIPCRPRKWFRPGHGWWNASMLKIAKKHGYLTVLGSVFPYDTTFKNPYINALYIWTKVYNGAVIVLHDRWVVLM